MSIWCEFKVAKSVCIETYWWSKEKYPDYRWDRATPEEREKFKTEQKAETLRLAKEWSKGEEPISMLPLPYGASPQYPRATGGAFCYTPNECKGRGSCPKSYACSE